VPNATTRPGADKDAARKALEAGKAKDAVAAAQRATANDPTDADAWLLLGAAQSELGNTVAARAGYRACVKSARHGAVRECSAMLR
jgi:Flp pilus assembly protein TadD